MATRTVPSSDDFLVRFPEFDGTDEDTIDAVIAEANRCVDDTWTAGDYTIAIMLLTAHLLTAADQGAALQVISQSIGPFSETYKAGTSWAEGSSYGQRFLQMLKRNQPPIMVI
jgi:hypothetical protein